MRSRSDAVRVMAKLGVKELRGCQTQMLVGDAIDRITGSETDIHDMMSDTWVASAV